MTYRTKELAIPASINDMMEARNKALNHIVNASESLSKATEVLERIDRHLTPYEVGRSDLRIKEITQDLDRRFWKQSFKAAGFNKIMDAEALSDLTASLKRNPPEFNLNNIRSTFLSVASDADTIFKRGIVNVFSSLSSEYKANSSEPFKIGNKIICNHMVSSAMVSQYRLDHINDLDRVFRIAAGQEYEPFKLTREVNAAWIKGEVYECELFKIKGFKKGSAHIWFKRQDLLDKVNKMISEYFDGSAIPNATGER